MLGVSPGARFRHQSRLLHCRYPCHSLQWLARSMSRVIHASDSRQRRSNLHHSLFEKPWPRRAVINASRPQSSESAVSRSNSDSI